MNTGTSRPVEQLVQSDSPLAGAEQRVLREWISEWSFDIRQFSTHAQPLVKGDIDALRQHYSELIVQHEQSGHTSSESSDLAAQTYQTMQETRLKMPAMEVVIAGAQYYMPRHNHQPDHKECLKFLSEINVLVDSADIGGFTAFMRASQTSHSRLDLAEVLLTLGANPNHRSRFGGVALHEALMAQDRKAVAFLIRNGASMDIKDNDGVSPRDIVSLIL
ncbi:hypothetical protein GGI25_001996 [Coemansia spiralis]|uniref:Uncharacterized protein n=2 Tax=Coemansia TaxID=4863 RepID=A0A9W8KYW4_9FUNG|nr:ankyrin repeat-containing domain protein [Coemansia spiralis]KAJ1986668.1 hypothetical protein EDC05_006202 [Coemansia umbellata]KAJ2623252.1 hypothetical protein GGI26_002479 [Coemansia sp. RSA 1358]KAJ2678804.1 hypothetical protein GGI25_001996 [Coemansia spiralis]